MGRRNISASFPMIDFTTPRRMPWRRRRRKELDCLAACSAHWVAAVGAPIQAPRTLAHSPVRVDSPGSPSMLGLGSTDPNKMSEDDAARVMNYARKEHPELMRQTVEEKPWFVKAMGNPVVMGALTMAAAKLLSNQRKGNA